MEAIRRWHAPELTATPSGLGLGELLKRESANLGRVDPAPAAAAADERPQGASAEMLQASYDEGFAAGAEEARRVANHEAAARIDALVAALERTVRSELLPLETEVVALARAMAKLVLHRECRVSAEAMHTVVRRALDTLATRQGPRTIRLHPDDAALVEPLLDELPELELRRDAALVRGSCRVEIESCHLDAGIDALVDGIVSDVGMDGDVGMESEPRTATDDIARAGADEDGFVAAGIDSDV